MQTGPTGFAAALAARVGLVAEVDVTVPAVDLGASTGWAESFEVTRELSGELPESSSIVVGGASARLTVRGDAYRAGAPSPMRPGQARSFLNSDVSAAVGYDGLTVPVFGGKVVDLDASEDSGELVLTGRDGADRLTAPVQLRPYGSFRSRVSGNVVRHPVNTVGIITSILHSNGIRMTPAPRDECYLSVPGIGGWLADIGWTVPSGTGAAGSWLTDGRFPHAPTANGELLEGYFRQRRGWESGTRVLIECYVNVTSGMEWDGLGFRLENGWTLLQRIESGQLQLVAYSPAYVETVLATASISTGWRHVAAQFRAGHGTRAWIDGVQVINSTTWGITISDTEVDYVAWVAGGIQDVKAYWASYDLPVPPTTVTSFTSEADLSLGALDLDGVPNVDGKKSWDVLRAIAEAELGMVGFSESGRFFFRSRADIAEDSEPVATWGVDLVDDIRTSVSMDTVFTRATVEAVRRTGQDAGRGAETPLSTAVPSVVAKEVIEIPSGASTYRIVTPDPVLAVKQKVGFIASSGTAYEVPVGAVVCTTDSGTTRYTGSGVSAWIAPVGVTGWEINFLNTSGSSKWLVWPTAWASVAPFGFDGGSAAFWILGYRYSAADPVLVDRKRSESVAAWGERVYAFNSSEWWQDPEQLDDFLYDFLLTTADPRPELREITVPADPRWQLGDVVEVTDWSGRVPSFAGRITSIRLTVDRTVENGLVGSYGLRQLAGTIPTITSHPTSTSVTAGSTVTFTAEASPAYADVQWQRDTGSGWANIAGATSTSYTTGTLSTADSGHRFRAVFSQPAGSEFTNAATLTVTAPTGTAPTVTLHPAPYTYVPGDLVTLTSAATGSPTPTVRWQVSTNGSSWGDVIGATSTTYAFYPFIGVRYYRAVFTNASGSANTNVATVEAYSD